MPEHGKGLSPLESRGLRSASALRFQAELARRGITGRIVELPQSTRTAFEAANAVGCGPGQIAKSLVFRGRTTGRSVLVLVAGSNRVDENWLARYVGEDIERADPDFVRSTTGFAIGGVPPVGHATSIPTYIDYDLLELPEVWAAAGHPNAVCRLTSGELVGLTHGRAVPVGPVPGGEDTVGRWATFDCYGTLVDWKQGFMANVRKMGLAETSAEGAHLFERYLAAEPGVESEAYRPYRDVMAETLIRAVRSTGHHLDPARAAELPESVPEWPVFPDVGESLAELTAGGFRVGILSNIDGDLLDRTLEHHGITADARVTAEDVRSYKPAPPHWIRFLKTTRAAPARVVHVSASHDYDLGTAKDLGFRTVYVARTVPLAHGRSADVSLPTLSGLARTAQNLVPSNSSPP